MIFIIKDTDQINASLGDFSVEVSHNLNTQELIVVVEDKNGKVLNLAYQNHRKLGIGYSTTIAFSEEIDGYNLVTIK